MRLQVSFVHPFAGVISGFVEDTDRGVAVGVVTGACGPLVHPATRTAIMQIAGRTRYFRSIAQPSLPAIINPVITSNGFACKGILLRGHGQCCTMTSPSSRRMPAFLALLAIVAVLGLACGCTQQASPAQQTLATARTRQSAGTSLAAAPAQEEKSMVTFTDKDNGTTADIAAHAKFAVQLRENPTTGYSWNASTGSGLTVLSSAYQEDRHAEGMVGVGGTRTWILQATGSGDQMFAAVYRRPWEAVTGNESAYTLTIHIVPS